MRSGCSKREKIGEGEESEMERRILGKLKATWAKWREQVTRKTIITLTRLGSGGKGISCFGFKKVPLEQFIHSLFI
jgi:hypothetical protein